MIEIYFIPNIHIIENEIIFRKKKEKEQERWGAENKSHTKEN